MTDEGKDGGCSSCTTASTSRRATSLCVDENEDEDSTVAPPLFVLLTQTRASRRKA